jgi:hypothetical protein
VKNLIVAGDSFCSDIHGWPGQLANYLGLEAICHGIGGQSWWNARQFLDSLDQSVWDNTEVVVIVHTNADRIPTHNIEIGRIDHSAVPTVEIDQAVKLYYKYIHDPKFLIWAQRQWFFEINYRWSNKKLVHLHSFPWTLPYADDLAGLNVTTNLCSISLNELAAEKFSLFNDLRKNHLNHINNTVLAQQLHALILDYKQQKISLNNTLFDLKTHKWFDWS